MTLGSLFASLVLLHAPTPGGQEKVWKDVYDKAKRAVVTIKTDSGTGSGFVVSMAKNSNYTPTWTADLKRLNETLLKNVKLDNCTFVITAYHVISDATEVEIVPNIGKKAKSPILYGYDASRDIAVLLVRSDLLTGSLPLGDYAKADVGDPIAVVGNPLGFLPGTLSTGIISAKRVVSGVPLLQFTASVSEGSSGSPVINKKGEVIGMVSASFEEGQSLNLAIGNVPIKNALVNVDRIFTDWSSNVQPKPRTEAPKVTEENKRKNAIMGELTEYVCSAALKWTHGSEIERIVSGEDSRKYSKNAELFLKLLDIEKLVERFRSGGANEEDGLLFRKELESVRKAALIYAETEIEMLREADKSSTSPKLEELIKKLSSYLVDLEDTLNALGDSYLDTWYNFDLVIEKVSGQVLYELFSDYRLPFAIDVNSVQCKVDVAFSDEFKEGDIIVGIKVGNARPVRIENCKDLWLQIEKPGPVEVTVDRKGKTVVVKSEIR